MLSDHKIYSLHNSDMELFNRPFSIVDPKRALLVITYVLHVSYIELSNAGSHVFWSVRSMEVILKNIFVNIKYSAWSVQIDMESVQYARH